jgi:hypothetical protein
MRFIFDIRVLNCLPENISQETGPNQSKQGWRDKRKKVLEAPRTKENLLLHRVM